MKEYFVCKFKDGSEENFERKCNSIDVLGQLIQFSLYVPETEKKLIYKLINVDKIDEIRNCYTNSTVEETFKRESELVVPDKKIITP